MLFIGLEIGRKKLSSLIKWVISLVMAVTLQVSVAVLRFIKSSSSFALSIFEKFTPTPASLERNICHICPILPGVSIPRTSIS
jgi:hypothetical protein